MKYIPRPGKTDEEALAHIAMIDGKIDSNEGNQLGDYVER
jgi:ribosomal-protein-alanine N-acetyltransferase